MHPTAKRPAQKRKSQSTSLPLSKKVRASSITAAFMKVPFTILNEDEIYASVQRIVRDTSAITGWPPITSRQLLVHCKWDRARLLHDWFEHGCANAAAVAAFFADAKVAEPLTEQPNTNFIIAAVSSSSICTICYNDDEDDCETATNGTPVPRCHSVIDLIGCGHKFCTDCWRHYITEQIRSVGGPAVEAPAMVIRCPEQQCAHALSDHRVAELLPADGALVRAFERAVCQSYVERTILLRWCPGAPDSSTTATTAAAGDGTVANVVPCRRAVQVRDVHTVDVTVTCACGHMFCFNCGLPEHAPLPCFLQRIWQASINRLLLWRDSKSADWMRKFSKLCPECRIPIEKTYGCDHMICLLCGHKFNWSEVAHRDVMEWMIKRFSDGYQVATDRYQRFDEAAAVAELDARLASKFDVAMVQGCWRVLRNVAVLFYFVRDRDVGQIRALFDELESLMNRLVGQQDGSVRGERIAELQRNLLRQIQTRIGDWNFTE